MLRYTAADLLALRHSRPPERAVRKAIFSFRLWLPGRARLLADRLFVNIASAITSVHSGLKNETSTSKNVFFPVFRAIPVVSCSRQESKRVLNVVSRPVRVLVNVKQSTTNVTNSQFNSVLSNCRSVPSLFVLNAAALAKPHAVNQLAVELINYNVDVAVITETHFKTKHSDAVVSVPGYALSRRDRLGRRGGGVAVYVRSTLHSIPWKYSADDRSYELLWIQVGNTFFGALYHPPRSQYTSDSLVNYIEACVDELIRDFPAASIVLAGDFNQLTDSVVTHRTGLTQIVRQPTRGPNVLDRIFVSSPVYSIVRVVTSVVRSDHKAVIAFADHQRLTGKIRYKKVYRKVTPAQHAQFLQYISTLTFDTDDSCEQDTQKEFDKFYDVALRLLNDFYPERTISVTSRDPEYITAEIKSKLRRKNRLMRAGRIDEASALAERIGKDIVRHNKTRLCHINKKTNSKDLWTAVRQLTGRSRCICAVDGITAESLNGHYARISTDDGFQPPKCKYTAAAYDSDIISEWRVFNILDGLRATATGVDQLPAWFLRLGAPVFCTPLARLFNLSLANSVIPLQWKQALICPVPKVATPTNHSDFRPISITPVLTRIMERIVVKEFLYPALLTPPSALNFSDQYAFRPTGSTTAAIIYILQTVTDLLADNPYVSVIALDFSKAFDTVRHYTLLEKIAMLDIPDTVYNWLVDFFSGHSHNTSYGGATSTIKFVSASIIQGSAIGPISYVVNAGDLATVTPGNLLCKYADDTYVIVPAANIQTRTVEC